MFTTILTGLYFLLILGVILVIIFDNGDSGRKLAWLLVISIIPLLGLILYFAFGINWRNHFFFEKRHQRTIDAFAQGTDREINSTLFGHLEDSKVLPPYDIFAKFMGHGILPSVSGDNDIEIITEGKRKFELLMKDISEARESIHMEYFHFGNDKGSKAVRELLMKKAEEGVKVRFIHENVANFPISSGYYDKMTKAGVDVVKFTNPRYHLLNLVTRLNYRNHRKIVVIDSKIAYTGGMNINDHYFVQWRDTHMRLTGPAVASLQYIFLDSYLTSGGVLDRPLKDYFKPSFAPTPQSEILPGGHPILRDKLVQIVPDEPDTVWPVIRMGYVKAFSVARKYIWLQTPYFAPPEPLLEAMKSAALSGVDVRLMLPEKADNILMRQTNRAFYAEVLEAGVKIYLRHGNFIHSKTFVCDDYLSSIGSANLDYRSLNINYEVNAYIYDEETALMNKDIFENDLKSCRQLDLKEWKNRPWYNKLIESIMRLFAAEL